MYNYNFLMQYFLCTKDVLNHDEIYEIALAYNQMNLQNRLSFSQNNLLLENGWHYLQDYLFQMDR